jgi:hypothetical protein
MMNLHPGDVDLASPLRSIAPGLDSAVLEVLARTESGLSASQIARLSARGTRAGQQPVLNRLVEHGLVSADPANTGYLYRLNREHVLAPAVLAAAAARREILHRLTAAVLELYPLPVHASIFGSFARGEGGAHSDIDLLLLAHDDLDSHDPAWTDQAHGLAEQVLAWTGNRLETLIFTESRFAQVVAQGEPIATSWLSDSVLLHGPSIETLVASSEHTADDPAVDRNTFRSGSRHRPKRPSKRNRSAML